MLGDSRRLLRNHSGGTAAWLKLAPQGAVLNFWRVRRNNSAGHNLGCSYTLWVQRRRDAEGTLRSAGAAELRVARGVSRAVIREEGVTTHGVLRAWHRVSRRGCPCLPASLGSTAVQLPGVVYVVCMGCCWYTCRLHREPNAAGACHAGTVDSCWQLQRSKRVNLCMHTCMHSMCAGVVCVCRGCCASRDDATADWCVCCLLPTAYAT